VIPGFQLVPIGTEQWVTDMANALQAKGYNATIAFPDWNSTFLSPNPSDSATAANNLYQQIVQTIAGLNLQPDDVIDLHIIAHSRGSEVTSFVLPQVLSSMVPQLAHANIEVTLCDPHPANLNNGINASWAPGFTNEGLLEEYLSYENTIQVPTVTIPTGVNQVEDFFETTPYTELSGDEGDRFNLQGLNPSQINSAIPVLSDEITGPGIGHTETHDFYMTNVIPTLFTDHPFNGYHAFVPRVATTSNLVWDGTANPRSFTLTVSGRSSGNVPPANTAALFIDGTPTPLTGTVADIEPLMQGTVTLTVPWTTVLRFEITDPGDHTLTAVYMGDPTFAPSLSQGVVVEWKLATHLAIHASPISGSGLLQGTASGSAFNVTVTALDANNQLAPVYGGTIHVTSTDPTASFVDAATGQPLIGNAYTFTTADDGTHVFRVDLHSVGAQSLSVADTADDSGVASDIASIQVLANLMPANLFDVAQLIAHSQEHYIDFVSSLYTTYLRRIPDVAGLSGWTNALLLREFGDDQATALFLTSPEYINRHGGFVVQTPSGLAPGRDWIVGLYADVLGRTPSDTEVQAWQSTLAAGLTPINVSLTFVSGIERERQNVLAAYQTFLGRQPSESEVDAYINALETNGNPQFTIEDLRGDFVGSPEYFFAITKGDSDPATWVRSAYMDLLGRPASDHEVNDIWVPILER
jgi:hypothetical protein